MSEKFPDPEESRRPDHEPERKEGGENEETGVATIDEVVGAIRMLRENGQESGAMALYAEWAKTQEQKRDAFGDAGDNRAVAKFMVESALDRAHICAAMGNIVDAYMSCFEAEYGAERSGVGELLPECQKRQDEYYDTSDIDTRIACDRTRARFIAQYFDGGIEAAFDVLDAAVAVLREENRPDLKQKIIETAIQILQHEWRRLCWYAESEKGAEVAPELMRLSELAYYINQEDMGQLFEEDAESAKRGELPLKANRDWPPEEDM